MIDSFVAFDVEMPSQSPMRISAIGITAVEKGEITERLFFLVNPQTEFDPYVVELIGITPEMVENEPTFPEIWEKIKDIMSRGLLVAHGAPGDLKAISCCLKDYGIEWFDKVKFICSCRVGLEAYPDLEHHSLNAMCESIGFPLRHHHALSDSEGCARLMLNYLEKGVRLEDYIQDFDVSRCHSVKKRQPRKKRSFREKVSHDLSNMQNEALRESFLASHRHIPRGKVIGVRTEHLRGYCKRLIRANKSSEFLRLLPHESYEEDNLHAMIISKTTKLSTAISRIDDLLPYVCDTLTCKLAVPQIFSKRQPELTAKLSQWLGDENEYAVYFALEVIERFYMTKTKADKWCDEVLALSCTSAFLIKKRSLLFAKALLTGSEKILSAFTDGTLDKVSRSKALSIAARLTDDPDEKEFIASLI